MKSFFYWFYSLRPVWLMIFLLFISTILISSNKASKLVGIKEFSLLMIENVHSFSGYFETNYELQQENIEIKKQLVKEKLEKNRYKRYILENLRLRQLLKLQPPGNYELTFAHVIGKSPYPGLRGFIINKGETDSLKKNDVVISSEGLVGKVLEVQSSTSIVQILLDRNIRISASILRNQERGILRFYDNSLLMLDYVVKSVAIKPGDIVITAPTSQIYNEGLKIGKVIEVENVPAENFQRIFILPSVNFNKLNEVIILKEKQKLKD